MTVAAPRAEAGKMENGEQNGKNGSRGSSDIRNDNSQKKKTRSSIWTLFSHADALDVWLMTIGIISTVGDGLSLPAVFFVSSKLMNSVGNGTSSSPSLLTHIINKNVVNLLYIACGSAVASFFEGYCWTRTGERQASRMRGRYLKAVLRQDIEYFDLQGASTADVVTGISNDSLIIQDFLSEKVPNFILNISTFLGSYTVGFILVWRLTLVTFPTILLLIIPGIVYGKMLMSLARKMRVENSKAGTIIEQAVSSIRTVYSFLGEERTMVDYSVALNGSVNYGLRRGLIQGIAIGSQGITFAIWALMAWYGSRLVMNHGSQGGSIFIVGSCINFGGISLGSALSNLKCFTEAATAGEHIMEVVRRLPKIDSESMEGETLQSTLGEVEFKGVGFAYPSRPQNQILRDFNLKIPTGTTVAMVGSSGSGKSTVLALLERFYDPDEGEILLDGVDIRKFRLKWLRSQMGLVSQEPVLFSMSIRDNILFGKEDATMEEVVAAAQASYAHNFISQLPDGYETKVGERGIQMSGGQKQRIAIARAILKSPKILLLDEATSALDSESERIVQEALDNASIGRTTIMIAHRLSTTRNADVIVVVQAGQVMGTGSHNDLICNVDGLYSNLSRLQQITTATEEQGPSISSSTSIGMETAPSRSSITSAGAEVERTSVGSDKLEVHHQVSSFRRLLKLTIYEWKHSLLGCLSAIVVGSTHPIHSFCLGNLISVYFLKDHNMIMKKTRNYCLVFICLSMLYFVSNIVQHYNFGAMGEYLTKRVRRKMLSTILTFEVGWFDKEENSTGSICSRLTNDAYLVKSLMADQMSLLVQALSGVAVAFILGLLISWQLALVMIAAQPIIIICFYFRRVLLKSMSDKAMKAQSESSKLAAEAVTDLRTITAFSSQDRILRLFELTQDAPRRESTRQSWFAGIGLGISLLLNRFTMAFIFWYGGKLVSSSSISPKSFFQTYLILVNTARIIAEAGTRTNDLAKGAHAVQSMFLLLDRLTLIEPENPDGFYTEKIQGNVEFRGVDFAYPARPQVTILKGLSLTIAAGKSMALVGRSGSGKSTVIGLVERFYDPTQGTVTVDGRDIKSYHLRSLRRHIALVGQQPVLFSGSVMDNITYGTEGATDTEVEDAARAANAHSFISCLQDGYKTWCGDKGVQLSGGQKQRIAIARAILKNPSILLLDEATSALDSQSEHAVQEALEKVMVGRTSIVIAHRLSTVKDCDHIGVMEKGMLVEIGTHDSLLEMGPEGSYYELVRFQQGAN